MITKNDPGTPTRQHDDAADSHPARRRRERRPLGRCDQRRHGLQRRRRQGTSSCFGTNLAGLIGLTAQSPIGTLGVLILALIAILMTFVQIALMVVRSAVLVLLPGVLPLTASFTSTPSGEQWFRRSLGWLVTFILYKPCHTNCNPLLET